MSTYKTKVDWKPELVLQMLDLVKQHPNLYDPKHIFYHDKSASIESYQKVITVLRSKCPLLTVEDVKIKFGSIRSHFVLLNRRMAHEVGVKLQYPYWYEHMEFLRPHLKKMRLVRAEEGGGPASSQGHKRFKQDEHLQALDSILGTKENSADLPLTEDTSEDDELSHLTYPHQRQYHPIKAEERSPYEAILKVAKDALERLTDRMSYSQDVEAFGEMVKSELQSIDNLSHRRRLRSKLMQAMIEHPKDD